MTLNLALFACYLFIYLFGPVLNMALEHKPDFLLNWFMILSFPNLSNKREFSDSNFNCPIFNSVALPHKSHAQALL